MKKIIFDVNPWNELYYNNCYYSALFAMLLHYKKSISPYLLSERRYFRKIDNYDDNKEMFMFEIERENLFEDRKIDINEKMGIEEKMLPKPEDIIDTIRECVERNTVPMIWIDCFYETIRPDAYQKNHWGHILIVYGYDDEQKTVEILEHSYTDSFTYKRSTMTYDDMRNCYNAFSEMGDRGEFTGILEFSNKNIDADVSSFTTECVFKYIEMMNKNKKKYFADIEMLEKISNDWAKMTPEEFYNNEKLVAEFDRGMGDVIRAKQMERYAYKKALCVTPELLSISTDILLEWRAIQCVRAAIFDSQKSFAQLVKRFKKVVKLEKTLLEELYLFMENKSKQLNYTIIDLDKYVNGIYISSQYSAPEGIEIWRVYDNPIIPDMFPKSNSVINFEGVPMKMPSTEDTKCDHIMLYDQTIKLEPKKYCSMYILGIGELKDNVSFYGDGEKIDEQSIFFHDGWTGIDIWEGGPVDNRIIAKMKTIGHDEAIQSLYLMKVEINPLRKIINEIRMPICPALMVFSITMEYEKE